MSTTPRAIVWFRRDLRLADNPALLKAIDASNGNVVATWILDDTFIAASGPTRTAFLVASLESLNASLAGALTLRKGEPASELLALAQETGANAVYCAKDFGPQGRLRDEKVAEFLTSRGIEVHFVGSSYIVDPGTVQTKTGTPCRVFTAFRRGWEQYETPVPLEAPEGVSWIKAPSLAFSEITSASAKFRPSYFGDLDTSVPAQLPSAGEAEAFSHLDAFLRFVDSYDEARNIPSLNQTSRLSPYLKVGAIHPRQVVHATMGLTEGRRIFHSEICWREFYADVLFHQPDSTWKVLQPAMEHLRIDRDAAAVERFQTWARGETGYPMVDAGMRQLRQEGWMHNRVRMIAASFLVKHLHLDWRWGAKWFMWNLIDGDVASNQHGWQWAAGTGTDAAPFHRVFNPTLQAERFDTEGSYVHLYVPELRGVPAPQCLQPGAGDGLLRPEGYPAPMIDANTERNEALSRFAEARESAKASK